jgi:DNA-binding transcriptional regulator PaaX
MEFRKFHNPDICYPIIRRRVAEEILNLLEGVGEMMLTRGRSVMGNSCLPDRRAYYQAAARLRKAGLIAYRQDGGRHPVLILTPEGKNKTPDVLRPDKRWKQKWAGFWYMLVYDVPEKHRAFRDHLRRFLCQMRMGCLQRSVWVSPWDVRPEFDDLVKAGGIDEHAYLFQAVTVLGRGSEEIVRAAWDFERLEEIHAWFCQVCSQNMERMTTESCSRALILTLAREETSAYLGAMSEDPLLPAELYPPGYRGRDAYRLHRRFLKEVTGRLRFSSARARFGGS